MKFHYLFSFLFFVFTLPSKAQSNWSICNSPAFGDRVDDVFMVNSQTGYAVCGDGQIVKTSNSGNNWNTIFSNVNYCRSVEFMNEQKGFVGCFPTTDSTSNILLKTLDGGNSWTDISSQLHPKAKHGICGLCIADSNTIYGCGNWFDDSAYIIKSIDGGNSWNFIDMGAYASSLIDMHFINKDTGFITGKSALPLSQAIILYTTNGGISWSTKFQNTASSNSYCWKIQQVNPLLYYASIEELAWSSPSVLKSTDGGMNWTILPIPMSVYNIEGIGFIDSLHGWTGGEPNISWETLDGGLTWNQVSICPNLNRVFRVNSNLLFASGNQIWKYTLSPTSFISKPKENIKYAQLELNPNPANELTNLKINIAKRTKVLLLLCNTNGQTMQVIDNATKDEGLHNYQINTNNLPSGNYKIVLKTHEDKVLENLQIHH